MKNEVLRKTLLSSYLVLGFLTLLSYIIASIKTPAANTEASGIFVVSIISCLIFTVISFSLYLFVIIYFGYSARYIWLFLVPFLGGLFFATIALKSKSDPKDFRLQGKVWNLLVLLGLFTLNQTLGSLFAFFAAEKGMTTFQVIIDLIFFSLTIAYFIYWGRKRLDAWYFKNIWSTKWIILIGIIAAFAWAYLWPFIVSLFGTSIPLGGNEEQLQMIEANTPAWLMWIHVAIGAPIMEETLFRLGIYELIATKSPKLGLAVSTIVFAMIHMLNSSILDWRVWGVYLGISFILGFAYYKTKKVEAPTAIHLLWNGIISLF